MKKTWTAWTIKVRDDRGGDFFIGRIWWFEGLPPKASLHQLDGCQCVLFKTRKVAREYLKKTTLYHGEGRVVKVIVTVEEKEHEPKKGD
jgi:hypothetical protein